MFLQKIEVYKNTYVVMVNKNNELARKNTFVDK